MHSLHDRYRKLVFFTWFLTLDLIMFGAFVRLTDSGLGCPDWPGCYGKVTPLGAVGDIREAVEAMPYGPVTMSKAWIEMIHRYVGSLLGMLIIAITWMAWRYRRELGHTPRLAVVTLIAVCVQGAFGAWTVTHKLMPAVVTAHLLGGMGLLALMTWLAARVRHHPPVAAAARRWTPWAAGGLALLFVQIALGGWVSTNYAALACMDFPTCHGSWVPPMDFAGGYSLIRGLGELPSGDMISQDALTAIHWVHRNFAFLVFAYLGALAWRLRAEPGLAGPARLILALLLAQLLTGLTTIFFQWPLLIAVLHNGGAAGLVLAGVTLLSRCARAGLAPPPAPGQARPGQIS
ncbi:Heme A synthase, cytochrome oxidase biogenesis protein Cox15-CtaA [plant metagenome]|uniref:Heme A synthase, cytochrome oxidase biogenesis protein Cox15-CtaA n=2 Tax=root TaxID=1 RepID=A0A1C3K4B9_9BURK|nr:COX15/CtaA family protein [Orrella dioscoreae]SBT26340.1 Heme A synthase, cytochrome oxidase biogenesis protein Cox15-CtaA [Orrella dioscoreae]SOE46474.1 Heme A synthase, cytochrome oxidase biogenesis protein Cox15-CtaA [Orrella dioscoreae]